MSEYVSFKCFIINLSGSTDVKIYNLLVLLFLSKVYQIDFRIRWKIKESDLCKLQFHDIFTNSIFKGKIFNEFIQEKDKTYYFNNQLSLKHLLMLSTIPTNQLNTKDNTYNNKPVVIYDYYVMNQTDTFIPDVLDWIVPKNKYIHEIREKQKELTLHANIQGFYNLYQQKRENKYVIGVFIPNKEFSIENYLIEIKDSIIQQQLTLHTDVLYYIGFDQVIFDKREITSLLSIFKEEFQNQLIYFNHMQGNGNLYSMMNLLCFQDTDMIITSEINDIEKPSIMRMFTLIKSQNIKCLQKK